MKHLAGGAVNATTGRDLAREVLHADTARDRMRGLLGRSRLSAGEALLLDPCRAIHTVGMRFPIDALFLDRSDRVVRATERMRPRRLAAAPWRARQVLELPAGTIESTGTKVGDRIHMQTRKVAGDPRRWNRLGNLLPGLLFGILAGTNLEHLLSVPTVSGSVLMLINGLSALLFCLRRKAAHVTRRRTDWGVALLTLSLPWTLRTGGAPPDPLSLAGSAVQAAGLLVVLCALFSLGRSFGIAPADRGLVDRGLYEWIRHPMYAGELLFFSGFVLSNPTGWNAMVLAILLIGLPIRAMAEERLLRNDDRYANYMNRVRWRFLPAIL